MDVGGARIAGFWRRLLAFFVDGLVLAVPAWVAGTMFFDQIAALGQNGRAIGVVIALAYFGLLNSRFGNGQTIGKRLLGVRVVGASGSPIGLLRSLVRAIVLTLPHFLNGLDLTPFAPDGIANATALMGAVAAFIVFGGGGAIVYLYVFNRRTRQSLHDLFVESYVVQAEPAGEVGVRIWPVHVAVALALLGGSLALPLALVPLVESVGTPQEFSTLWKLRSALIKDPAFSDVSVQTNTFSITSARRGTQTTTYLVVTVTMRTRVDKAQPIIDRVAAKVLALEPKILGRQKLKVVVVSGFDLGILRMNQSTTDLDTPEGWRKRLGPEATSI